MVTDESSERESGERKTSAREAELFATFPRTSPEENIEAHVNEAKIAAAIRRTPPRRNQPRPRSPMRLVTPRPEEPIQ